MNRPGVASSSSAASAAQMPSPEPELDALAIQQAVAFVEFGGVLTIYLASGKRKHDRFFWVDAPALAWDKKKKVAKKPNKYSVIVAVEANAPTTAGDQSVPGLAAHVHAWRWWYHAKLVPAGQRELRQRLRY